MKRVTAYFFLFIFIICFPLPVSGDDEQTIKIIVEKDESLIKICELLLEDPKQWRKIAEINSLKNPNLIHPGQTLLIPVVLLKGIPIDGKVTFVKGDVTMRAPEDERWKLLHLNDVVRQGSSLKTGDLSALEIMLEDGTTFFLRQNTTLSFRSSVKKGLIHTFKKLFLQTGRAITRLKEATGKGSRFEIYTPSAVAAARGTEFRTSVDMRNTTRSEVLEGGITVEAMKKSVEVNEGEGTLVRQNEPPVQPRKLLAPPDLIELKPTYKLTPLTFNFERIEKAYNYRVMLAVDKDFKDVIKEGLIRPDETFRIQEVPDGEYFLSSRSIDSDGLEGIPSDVVSVNVRVNPLPPFIQSPEDSAEIKDNSVSFKWLKVRDAVRYHFQIADDKSFSGIVVDRNDIAQSNYQTDALGFKTYYYRVRSIADDGYEGAWSEIQNFTLVPP
jgi:hypothetical protein